MPQIKHIISNKAKLKKIKKRSGNNMKKICFDIDGVICRTKKNLYTKSVPIKKNIKMINSLYDQKFKILIFTARYMGRNSDNIVKAKKRVIDLLKNS